MRTKLSAIKLVFKSSVRVRELNTPALVIVKAMRKAIMHQRNILYAFPGTKYNKKKPTDSLTKHIAMVTAIEWKICQCNIFTNSAGGMDIMCIPSPWLVSPMKHMKTAIPKA